MAGGGGIINSYECLDNVSNTICLSPVAPAATEEGHQKSVLQWKYGIPLLVILTVVMDLTWNKSETEHDEKTDGQ